MLQQALSILLSQLAEMPAFLQRTAMSLPREALLRPPESDRSPLLEHLWHIRDCESDLYGLRIHRVLHEHRPHLEPIDVGAWVQDRQYLERNGNQAIIEFEQLRTELIAKLSGLTPQSLGRSGVRADGTEVNVLGLMEQLVEHDQDHRWRIAAILRNYAGFV